MVYFGGEELDIPRITINGCVIERVFCAKLLGCHIVSNMSWEDHIANLVSKASRRIHLLRELKRAGLYTKDFLTCYFSIVRSTTEYVCQVWSTSLTNSRAMQLSPSSAEPCRSSPPQDVRGSPTRPQASRHAAATQ